MSTSLRIFADHAEEYRRRGFWPRPVPPGTKSSLTKWQVTDEQTEAARVSAWARKYPSHGLALVMGSPFADRSRLGAVDIDDQRFVRLAAALLGDPSCARLGARGLVFFVRVTAKKPNRNFVIKTKEGSEIKVGELLVDRKLCLIPPTIHPIGQPYRWIGRSLLDVDYVDLPLIED